MEKEQDIHGVEIAKPPFFKKAVLTFSSSGHYLRESDRHYRCDLDCRGGCDKNELQIKKEDMERNFSRYAQKFVLPSTEKTFAFADKLMKQLFHGIVDGEDWGEVAYKEQYLDTVVDAMKAEIPHSGQILESDIDELQKTFTRLNAIDNRTLLITTLLSVFKSISESENETYLARDISNISKKVYISDKGKIQSILFERWGWYILNYINRNFPEYFGILEKNGVKVLNKKDDPILSLELQEAISHFSEDNFEEALHSQSVEVFYNLFSMIKKIIDPIMRRESNEKQKEAVIKSIEYMSSPQFQSIVKILQVGGARIKRKRNMKKDFDSLQ